MSVDVVEAQTPLEHHDLRPVQELGDFLRQFRIRLVFGRDPDLTSLFDDLLAQMMDALSYAVTVPEPSGRAAIRSDSSANSESKVFTRPILPQRR